MKMYGVCPAMGLPGNAPIAAVKMDSAINKETINMSFFSYTIFVTN
jgi:hypothetical protein